MCCCHTHTHAHTHTHTHAHTHTLTHLLLTRNTKSSAALLTKHTLSSAPSTNTEHFSLLQPPQPIGFEGGGIESRRAVLVFHTPGDANAAFSSLVGTSSTDSNGRTTKEVPLPGEGPARTIKVCWCVNDFARHQAHYTV